MISRFFAVLIVLILSSIPSLAQEAGGAAKLFRGGDSEISISKLVTNESNQTEFIDVTLRWKDWFYSTRSSEFLPSKYLEFFNFEKNMPSTFHTSTANQILIILEGTLIIEASSGEVREFPPGTAVWETDIEPTSEGHKARMKDGISGYGVKITIDHRKLR